MHSDHIISVGHEFFETLGNESHGSQTQYILSFITSGNLTMHYKEPVKLSSNMFTLVPAGMPHGLISGEKVAVWWMSFCPTCMGMTENDPLMQPFAQIRTGALPAFKLSKDRAKWVISLFHELQLVANNLGNNQITHVSSLLNLILIEVNNASKVFASNHTRSDKVTAALEYIHQHYAKSISLKDVAKAVHSSPSYLATKVKAQTGYSVGEWIIKNRLAQACARLLHTDKPVNTVVYELGWNDTTHFIRQFKKAYGVTPASWRKSQQNIIR
ncbi:AraC family transcriptional regulator [Pseudoalteromonas sp. MMG022]|uniref:AraC family transcriptional regulator n=1 Tax=Pseudoalteromonas sp. MMG022 TaxID=2909978 RepID=UPI001F1E8823|nr:AraC family transcriptional regulator [Pseudoalteromonas sp. MMG022]MCF6433951.1 AraC family transcriptional regulator [Pseudoalteromonas sp. MMG022]